MYAMDHSRHRGYTSHKRDRDPWPMMLAFLLGQQPINTMEMGGGVRNMNIQLILFALRCHIYKFTYLLNCFCNLKSNPPGAFPGFSDLLRMVESQLPEAHVPSSCFSSHVTNKCSFLFIWCPAFCAFCW